VLSLGKLRLAPCPPDAPQLWGCRVMGAGGFPLKEAAESWGSPSNTLFYSFLAGIRRVSYQTHLQAGRSRSKWGEHPMPCSHPSPGRGFLPLLPASLTDGASSPPSAARGLRQLRQPLRGGGSEERAERECAWLLHFFRTYSPSSPHPWILSEFLCPGDVHLPRRRAPPHPHPSS